MQETPEQEPKPQPAPSVTTAAVMATLRTMRQLFILVIGLTVVLLGIAMILLPGPGALTIILGLMILGIEFAWARRWMAKIKSYIPKRKPNAAKTAAALPSTEKGESSRSGAPHTAPPSEPATPQSAKHLTS